MSGRKRTSPVLLAALFLGLLSGAAAGQDATALRRMVESAIARGKVAGTGRADFGRYRAKLLALYPAGGATTLWVAGGRPTAQAESLLVAIARADDRGLDPGDYDAAPLARLADAVRAGGDADAVVPFDAGMSLAALRLMTHVDRGRVEPSAVGFALPSDRTSVDMVAMTRVLAAAPVPREVLDALEPPFARFVALEKALQTYRVLAASPDVAPPPSTRTVIRPGDAWLGVPALVRYLAALGDLPANAVAIDDTLDDDVDDGVVRFQQRHGLDDDGVIGPATMAALRTPLAARVRQIELAIERWRWLPRDRPPRFAVVNIPAYRLLLFDRDRRGESPALRLDVIVGRAYGKRRTPVFAGVMRQVVFHPFWDVPPSIARKEEVPHIRRDWSYAERNGFEIVRGGDVGARIYAMSDANLDRVVAGELRLRQRPGRTNALGAVKFVFPNDYNVYLHGTPMVQLFAEARRDFSHGCIRVSDPAALARFVLDGEPGWDTTRIADAMSDSTGLLRLTISRPLPVYVLYATVVVNEEGTVRFYPDVYGHDARLARVLGIDIPRAPAAVLTAKSAEDRSGRTAQNRNCKSE